MNERTGKKRIGVKDITVGGLLVAVALALSVAERVLPIGALIPLPGIKLGLANVVTMMALLYIGPSGALAIVTVRCLLGGLFTGITSMLFSLTGGLFAFAAMLLTRQLYGRAFSIFGISMAGAAFHNIGQILMAALLLGEGLLYTYLPVLLLTGLATGILTAAVAGPLFARLEKTGFIARHFSSQKRYFYPNRQDPFAPPQGRH